MPFSLHADILLSRFISGSTTPPTLNQPRAGAWGSDFRRRRPNQSPESAAAERVKPTLAKTYETRHTKIEWRRRIAYCGPFGGGVLRLDDR